MLASAQFSVSGRVTDQQTGEALPGATITIQNQSASVIANANGNYKVENLQPGSYVLQVAYIGYQA